MGGSEERQYRDCGWGKNLSQHGWALVRKVGRGARWMDRSQITQGLEARVGHSDFTLGITAQLYSGE